MDNIGFEVFLEVVKIVNKIDLLDKLDLDLMLKDYINFAIHMQCFNHKGFLAELHKSAN